MGDVVTSVSVVVPWRPGCPHREAAWDWVRRRWLDEFPDWDLVVVTDDSDDPWCKGKLYAAGLGRASGDIIVWADADVWCPQVTEAVEAVANGAPWVQPHNRLTRLSEQATAAVLAGADPAAQTEFDQKPYVQLAAGGFVVATAETLRACPIDPRFAGWGGEDHAHGYTLDTLAGPRVRLNGPLWHLWHPHPPRLTRLVGSEQSENLRRRYALANGRPDAIRELLAEIGG